MEFFEAVQRRRSIRKYLKEPVPSEVMEKALEAALLAPNSSNMQTWGFYWVKTEPKRKTLIEACLNQNAARTAQELLVVAAIPSLWRKTQKEMMRRIERDKSPAIVRKYYESHIPFGYGWQILAPLKWLMLNLNGLFKPSIRHPWNYRDIQEISIKSAALAAENFMLAISAQGFDTCPMEGFDEKRVKKLVGLGFTSRIVMVVSVGKRDEKGVWGPQVRFDRDWFVHSI